MSELSDADLLQPKELSDADVMQPQQRASPLAAALVNGEFDALHDKLSQTLNPTGGPNIEGADFSVPYSQRLKVRAAGQFKAGGLLNDLYGIGNGFASMASGLIEGVADLVRLPGDVWTGKQPSDTASLVERTAAAALTLEGMRGASLVAPKPFVRETPIQPIPAAPALPRSHMALTGDPVIDAVIQHPVVQGTIDNAVIDRQHTIPYEAGASLPLENPTTYVDRHVPQTFTAPRLSDPKQTVTFDTGEPMAIHENVEVFTMKKLIDAGWPVQDAYRAAHFGFAEQAEHAWYRANDIDPAAAEAQWKKLQPGIQHEIADQTPADLYHAEYPGEDVTRARHEEILVPPPPDEMIAKAKEVIANLPDFAPKPNPIAQAADLGVIGPGRPDLTGLPPKEAAARAIPAARTGDDVLRGPGPQTWEQRFDQFTRKLDTPEQVQTALRESAKENDGFVAARAGEIPLSQVERIAEAAGVEPGSVNPNGLGRLLKNDNMVRGAMQMMLQKTDALVEAARSARADPSPENLIALQDAIMKRDMTVEQVVGLRAEWGRTGKVFQEFMDSVKDAQALGEFLKGKGRSTDDLRGIADTIAGLNSPEQVARFANDMRKPSAWDKYLFYWVNALISGPVTHIKYIGANGAYALYESGVVTPIAGALGAARRLGGGTDGIYAGEAMARFWGLMAGTPGAFKAAIRAARENIQVPLPGEAAKNFNPVINQRPNPIGGVTGAVIGVPSRAVGGIHSFFNFLGYRAGLEAEAYRVAAKEGHTPFTEPFMQRWREMSNAPTDAMMEKAIDNGYKLTFISEQGKVGQAISRLTRDVPVLKLVVPFNHIPGQILRAGIEQTPAAFLDSRMRADLLGRNGAEAADMARARIIGGSILAGMVMSWAVADRITGAGPSDPTDRAIWLRSHQPYSVRIGNQWVSYDKFGPIGDLVGMVANLSEIGQNVPDGKLEEGAWRLTKATGQLLQDEVGMQGLGNLIEAMDDPEHKGVRFLSSQVASNIPFSSLLRQTASITDPYMREAKTFVDQLRYTIPYARQDLFPKRDPITGEALPNPGFGNVLRQKAVSADPLDAELARLEIKPGAPLDRIGGVKLTPALYDRYQATAGPLTKTTLDAMVQSPNWGTLPDYIRRDAILHSIEGTRRAAASVMQALYPELIQAGIQQRLDYITGASKKPRQKDAPASLESVQP